MAVTQVAQNATPPLPFVSRAVDKVLRAVDIIKRYQTQSVHISGTYFKSLRNKNDLPMVRTYTYYSLQCNDATPYGTYTAELLAQTMLKSCQSSDGQYCVMRLICGGEIDVHGRNTKGMFTCGNHVTNENI